MNYCWEKIFSVYYYIANKFYPTNKEEPTEPISQDEKERIAQIRVNKFTPMTINKPKKKFSTVRKDKDYEQMMTDWFS